MSYTKSTIISRPVESPFAGVSEALGVDWSNVGSGVLDFFGQGIKAQGAQEALAAQLAAQNAAQAAKSGGGGGISTTMLLVGGVALAGVLVFAMRRK
jgi:hypothetical protein